MGPRPEARKLGRPAGNWAGPRPGPRRPSKLGRAAARGLRPTARKLGRPFGPGLLGLAVTAVATNAARFKDDSGARRAEL